MKDSRLDTSAAIPIFEGKGDMNCGMYRGARPLEDATKIVE